MGDDATEYRARIGDGRPDGWNWTSGNATHLVTNQVPPRVDIDEFAANRPLQEAVRRYDAGFATDELAEIGTLVGSVRYQGWADAANRHRPRLMTHDRYGRRIDEIVYAPEYHEIISRSMAFGAHTGPWSDPRPGAHAARAAGFLLFNQAEPGHCCPISMTYSALPSLRHQPDLAAQWEPLLVRRGYDPALRPAPDKPGVLVGMAMTEKQGGSDVRANSTVARPVGPAGAGREYLLTGHKWFCSAPMCDAFLVLAQAVSSGSDDAKLSCFLMPRVLPDGRGNAVKIQRLKDKLGNWSNASAEIELDGARAHMVGEPGAGVRVIIEMVAHTRLDCVIGAAGGMRQGLVEAAWHAGHRAVFGRALADQPVMTSVLADLALESEAATATAMRLAHAHEDGAGEEERAFRRIATPVAKYWVCKRGPGHAYEAMECLGGNGYIEDFPLARRYREAPVLPIWEGSGNVIALDVLRGLVRDEAVARAFMAEVGLASGRSSLLDAHLDSVRTMLEDLGSTEPDMVRARGITEAMALALEASLLVRTAPNAVAGAFISSRLGPNRGHGYGVLPPGTDTAGILARHVEEQGSTTA